MQYKLLHENGPRTYALVLDTGDEVIAELTRFAREQNVSASQFTGLGAFQDAVLGFFDVAQKRYLKNHVAEQVEVVSLVGDITLDDGEPALHPHVVVATRDGNARGGHLLEAHVRPTLELVVTESPAHLRRRHDETTGLALIDIGQD
jgi:predicted DNA-binding protein with PD1-like motif